MVVIGLIVEYNPFHNGHLHHIHETKKMFHPDLLVAVMSGNYTQRGDIAILDKFVRAEIALKHGIDLVIELPYRYATSSADQFSEGAIRLLSAIKCDAITFGSERNNVDELSKIASIIDSDTFQDHIKRYLKEGHSYPKASQLALSGIAPNFKALDTNDTLGVQYIRAIRKINPSIRFHSIKRIESHYHDKHLGNGSISSATAIRKAVMEKKTIDPFVPIDTALALQQAINDWSNYYPYLRYQTISLGDNLKNIHDMTEGLDRRIRQTVLSTDGLETLLNQLTSRRHTESKMKRLLLHILNQYTRDDFQNHQDYIRILGFRKEKSSLIKRLIKDSPLPVITNVRKDNYDLLKTEIRVDQIYHLNDLSKVRKIPIWV